jgi:uncharacterized protein YoxC
MSPAVAWVLVALAAVLVGAAVPVLVQLRKTLRTAQETLENTGGRVNAALDQLTTTLDRVNRATQKLEHGVGQVSSLLEVLGGIGDALSKVRSSIGAVTSLGSVLGGAILGALGFRSREPKAEPKAPAPAADEVETR